MTAAPAYLPRLAAAEREALKEREAAWAVASDALDAWAAAVAQWRRCRDDLQELRAELARVEGER